MLACCSFVSSGRSERRKVSWQEGFFSLVDFFSGALFATVSTKGGGGLKKVLRIGAHPSYPDRANFGRVVMNLTPEEIVQCVYDQVQTLVELASRAGCAARHVKPHGALYNVAAQNPTIAAALAHGVRKVDKTLILLGLAGSKMLEVWQNEGFRVVGEAFVDRRYEADGTLRSRKFSDALITDLEEAVQQALRIVKDGVVITADGAAFSLNAQTLCIHSDTHNAISIAAAVRSQLLKEGFAVRPL
jgi:UPF0271 protein